jgi:hypothetical protein
MAAPFVTRLFVRFCALQRDRQDSLRIGSETLSLMGSFSLRKLRRDDLKSVIGDNGPFPGSVAVEPAALLCGIAIILRYIGLSV